MAIVGSFQNKYGLTEEDVQFVVSENPYSESVSCIYHKYKGTGHIIEYLNSIRRWLVIYNPYMDDILKNGRDNRLCAFKEVSKGLPDEYRELLYSVVGKHLLNGFIPECKEGLCKAIRSDVTGAVLALMYLLEIDKTISKDKNICINVTDVKKLLPAILVLSDRFSYNSEKGILSVSGSEFLLADVSFVDLESELGSNHVLSYAGVLKLIKTNLQCGSCPIHANYIPGSDLVVFGSMLYRLSITAKSLYLDYYNMCQTINSLDRYEVAFKKVF